MWFGRVVVVVGGVGLVVAGLGGAASAGAAHRVRPSCAGELAGYRLVSRQAGLRIGSDGLPWSEATSPRLWARELRAAGDWPLAATAAGIRGPRSADLFVLALTASAVAALQGEGCRSGS